MENENETGGGRQEQQKARTHLSNERTFLAWIRTGIAMIGFGFIVARLQVYPTLKPASAAASALGIAFAAGGVFAVALAAWRFFVTRKMIEQQSFRSFGYTIAFFAFVVIGIGIGIVIYLAGVFSSR